MGSVAEELIPKERQKAVIGVIILNLILTLETIGSTKVNNTQCLQGVYESGGERGIRTHGSV